MFSDVITVFNLHGGLWYPHVLNGVDATGIATGKSATTLNGVTSNDNGYILIQTVLDTSVMTEAGALPYTAPKEYAALENGENAITFQPQTDFIKLGSFNTDSPISDDDFETGFFDEMNSKYDGVYQIVSVAHYSLIPHFEIGVR